MKQKCPYCGRKISYISAFSSRRKAEFVCGKCGKESRVVINKAVIPVFGIFAVISLALMGLWTINKLSYNPLGIIIVAVPLIVFLIISPKFVRFEPLKKYKKSMEAKKAGREFSDTLTDSDSDSDLYSVGVEGSFHINADVFNEIKADRTAAREGNKGDNIVSDSSELEKPENIGYVPVIDDVSENHAGTDEPLRKIRSNSRRNHFISTDDEAYDDDVKTYVKPEKNDGNRFSSNRRF